MDEDELRAKGCGPLEELARGGHSARNPRHLRGAGDLQPHGAIVGIRRGVEELVRKGEDLVSGRHDPVPYGRFGV